MRQWMLATLMCAVAACAPDSPQDSTRIKRTFAGSRLRGMNGTLAVPPAAQAALAAPQAPRFNSSSAEVKSERCDLGTVSLAGVYSCLMARSTFEPLFTTGEIK